MIWQKKKIGDLINLKRGYDLPSSDRIEGEVPIISSAGITDYHNEFKKCGEGVVTGRYGTLGEVFYINGKYWPLNTTTHRVSVGLMNMSCILPDDPSPERPRFAARLICVFQVALYSTCGALPRHYLYLYPPSLGSGA